MATARKYFFHVEQLFENAIATQLRTADFAPRAEFKDAEKQPTTQYRLDNSTKVLESRNHMSASRKL